MTAIRGDGKAARESTMRPDGRCHRREHPPVPPRDFPPARTVIVPDRGEFFLRDSGGDDPVVLMLHGWTASADLNFGGLYDDVISAGYRVIAIDHRGHGRGLRPLAPFRLVDCAADAAAVIRTLGVGAGDRLRLFDGRGDRAADHP